MANFYGALRMVAIALLAAAAVALVSGPPRADARGADLPEGPIPCLDGSTVEIGELCPLPTFECADGSTVPIGQLCPLAPKAVNCPDGSTAPTSQQCPTSVPTPQRESRSTTCPDGTVVRNGVPCPTPAPVPEGAVSPDVQQCRELGTC